jgi:hypothetical protein
MAQTLNCTIKPFLLAKPKQLVIEPKFIEFGVIGPDNNLSIRFQKEEIDSIRYVVKGIRGYKFYIGRVYCIDLRSKCGKTIKMRFRSFYNIKRKMLDANYVNIINALQENFMLDISREYIKKFAQKEVFELLGITFLQDSIILDKKWDPIPWLDVATKTYRSYFAVFSMTEPYKYKAFKYGSDWNTTVLYSVSKSILKGKGIWTE